MLLHVELLLLRLLPPAASGAQHAFDLQPPCGPPLHLQQPVAQARSHAE